MDIKLKKNKTQENLTEKKQVIRNKKERAVRPAISFIAWWIGTALLVFDLFALIKEYDNYSYNFIGHVKEVFDGDYQNTEEFKICMSDYLNNFLAMSIGEPIYGYNESKMEKTYTEVISAYTYASEGLTVIEDVAPTRNDIEENSQKEAQQYHESVQNNRNILYTVKKGGKVLYTNEESLGMYEENFVMPAGYNYLLYFDGKRITAIKDGKEVDIYGDGYYRGNNNWYIPGYINFPADEEVADSEICIVAAKVPSIIIGRNYNGDGGLYYSNTFYSIQENLSVEKRAYSVWLFVFLLAVIFMAVGIICHKSKKEANLAIAKLTGKIWFEIKVLSIICIVALNAVIFLEWWWYRNGGFILSGVIFLNIFGIFWLFLNDIRYNEKPWRKSIVSAAYKLFETSTIKLPLGKRIVRQYMLVYLGELAAVLIMIIILGIWGSIEGYENEAVILVLAITVVLAVSWICQSFYAVKNKKTALDIDTLAAHIEDIRNGKLPEPVKVSGDSYLSKTIDDLNDIQKGMNKALEEQIKSERMKVELIANVSHDIKTPLTSIISYAELLKQEDGLPEHVKEYISILENKAQRLKAMVQDVFEVSKAASGELPMHMDDLDLGKLMRQTLADMSEQIEEGRMAVKTEIPESAVMIHADGGRLYRVFQNLIENALKYSLEGTRIYVTLQKEGKTVIAGIKNISREELSQNMDFTERFTRGDKSRSDGGSGLGLSIAQSFTEACGGTFKVETIADLFVVTVSFTQVD